MNACRVKYCEFDALWVAAAKRRLGHSDVAAHKHRRECRNEVSIAVRYLNVCHVKKASVPNGLHGPVGLRVLKNKARCEL